MDVSIVIRTEQFAPDNPFSAEDTVETGVRGTFRKDDEGIKLCYEEPDEAGLGRCRTSVVIAPDGVVTVKRSGATRSQMVIERGVKHDCFYQTEVMPFSLATEGVSAHIPDTEALPYELKLEYLLYTDGKVGARNRMRIEVCRAETD